MRSGQTSTFLIFTTKKSKTAHLTVFDFFITNYPKEGGT
ncbi:hypothetical protein RV11_GL001084 [Enterococcus phoeniculicola]|nr:hypothetical protein RV11_GL001084 [Enterococcus phoeniculicola]